MAGSSEDRRRSNRRRGCLDDPYGDEPEEGEFVPGYHSVEGYDGDRDCSIDSEDTISDSVAANNGDASPSSPAANNNGNGSSSSAADQVHGCPLCGKEFRSHNAVRGHMRVHQEQGIGKDRGAKPKRKVDVVVEKWGATGKRGCSGSRVGTSSSGAKPDQSMAVVAEEPKIVSNLPSAPTVTATPIPSSVPMASATATTKLPFEQPIHEHAVEVEAANPPIEADAHLHSRKKGAPVHQQPIAPPPRGQQNPKENEYTCKKCDESFKTHQGLGGHMTAHNRRERAAAALQDAQARPLGVEGRGFLSGATREQSMAVVAEERKMVLQPMPTATATSIPSFVPMASATTTTKLSSEPAVSGTPNPSSVPVAPATAEDSVESSSAKPIHNDRVVVLALMAGADPHRPMARPQKTQARKVGARTHRTGPPINDTPRLNLGVDVQALPPPGTAIVVPAPSVKADEASSAPGPAAVAGTERPSGVNIGTAVRTTAAQLGSSATDEASASAATVGSTPSVLRLFGVDIDVAVQTPPAAQQGSPATAGASSSAATGGKQ